MKRRGFTLIELLAVIVILAIIALIAVPTIINIIENAQKSAFKNSAYVIIKAGELYYTNQMMEPEGMTEDKTFTFPEAVGLEYKGSKPTGGILNVSKEGKVAIAINNGKYCATKEYNTDEVTVSDNILNCSFEVAYREEILYGAYPELQPGMIPVTISNTGVATVADIYNKENPWYKYEEKKWANVVTVTETSRGKYINNDGIYKIMTNELPTIVEESDILTYLTWIPRYKYKLWNVDNHTTTGVVEGKIHSIEIVFENNNTDKSNGTTNGSYLTHPAFTFGGKGLNGMWVGKFETGYSGATSTTTAQVETADSSKVIIKPNTYSWRKTKVANEFYTVLGMNAAGNVFGFDSGKSDTHMMKNTEWGAVAYLSHSVYGKDGEVYINNNSTYLTGCGGDTASEEGNVTCKNGYGTKSNGIYNQSTTGNITGVFDMAGGAFENVMGYNTRGLLSTDTSGFSILPADKYVDKYIDATDYSYRILGDATGEMGPFNSTGKGSWYYDASYFIFSGVPWFRRGDIAGAQSTAGIFGFSSHNGNVNEKSSFRVVILNK